MADIREIAEALRKRREQAIEGQTPARPPEPPPPAIEEGHWENDNGVTRWVGPLPKAPPTPSLLDRARRLLGIEPSRP